MVKYEVDYAQNIVSKEVEGNKLFTVAPAIKCHWMFEQWNTFLV